MFGSRVKFDTAVFFICCCIVQIFGKDTVKYAAVIFRHGQRTPVKPYPTDPYRNESLWPVKFGELTNTGKMQHYALGQWLRTRYADLISEQFDPSEVYVRSTDYDRTLMSAQANLAGLFPPTGKSVWNKNLDWQPIPIHSEPLAEDCTLYMGKPCQAYDDELKRYRESKEYKKSLYEYQKLMNYLSAYTGETVTDYEKIEYLYSNLYIETLFNFTLPNWTQSVFPDEMAGPAAHSFKIPTGTPLLARLRAGPLLQQIVSHMEKVVKSDNSSIKLSIYSAHDDTVGFVLNALSLFDDRCPVFTATVLLELVYDDITRQYSIQISYRNSTEIVEPNLLSIPYCGEKCELERFKKLYHNLLGVNWEVDCNNKSAEWSDSTVFYIFGILLILVIFGMREYTNVSRIFEYSLVTKSSDMTNTSTPHKSKSATETENLATII